ncbi:MAG TPA: DUF2784 domain-containing protein [Anaeromyxobacter sp.]|nr:DUF2784 domain-containing protein [Anaeromyxobacter sp.]
MIYRVLADAVLVFHSAFIVFVVLGGLLVRWRRRVAFVHLPCAVYGAAIELWGWICPLTPLENRLRVLGGERGYAGGFIEHYLLPLVYPEPLTTRMQALLGVLVAAGNVAIYAWALRGRAPRRRPLAVGHLRGRAGR